MSKRGLMERLNAGEAVIVGEGFLFEFEHKGYLRAGCYVPEVVLEHPDLLRNLHREYAHAGSDVVLAFTYYGHREKLRLIGREDDVEKLNRKALKIAREVADETGTLMAGNICNSTIYKPGDPESKKIVMEMAEEQIRWAVEAGADYILGETYFTYEEASIALSAIKKFAKGLPAVITLAVARNGLYDGVDVVEACHRLEKEGADVVGLNCVRGPASMFPYMAAIRKKCKCPIAFVPVPYRTNEEYPTFQALPDVDHPEHAAFPNDLDAWQCTRTQLATYGKKAWDLGVQYLGVCCGNRAGYLRALAEAVGRTPPASRFTPDMSQHYSRLKDASHIAEFEQYGKDYTININPIRQK